MKKEDSGINIAFLAGDTPKAQKALKTYTKKYGNCPVKSADVIVALGGDGFMIKTMKDFMDRGLPIYGVNKGTAGFLSNEPKLAGLKTRIGKAVGVLMRPLKMKARKRKSSETVEAYAMNEVLAFRHGNQLIKARIWLDDEKLMDLFADGAIVSTPQGSTAYNMSAGGIALPVSANVMTVTGVNPYKPRHVRGIVDDGKTVVLKALDADRRPIDVIVDGRTVMEDISSVEIIKDKARAVKILFDPHHDLDRRILDEQFPGRSDGIVKSHRVR